MLHMSLNIYASISLFLQKWEVRLLGPFWAQDVENRASNWTVSLRTIHWLTHKQVVFYIVDYKEPQVFDILGSLNLASLGAGFPSVGVRRIFTCLCSEGYAFMMTLWALLQVKSHLLTYREYSAIQALCISYIPLKPKLTASSTMHIVLFLTCQVSLDPRAPGHMEAPF